MAAIEPTIEAPTTDGWIPEDTLADRLIRIRGKMGWNISEAAKACEVSNQSWHNWEKGANPRDLVDTAKKIAKASGCDPEWLVLGAENCRLHRAPDLRLVDDLPLEPPVVRSPDQLEIPFPPHLQVVR